MTACHVALISMREGLEGIAVPCKLYGILASGVPVVAQVPANSEIAYVVEEERCGIVVTPRDTEGLVEAISFLRANDDERREMGMQGRRAFIEKYTTSIAAKRFLEILQ